jgi:hypothetical protein
VTGCRCCSTLRLRLEFKHFSRRRVCFDALTSLLQQKHTHKHHLPFKHMAEGTLHPHLLDCYWPCGVFLCPAPTSSRCGCWRAFFFHMCFFFSSHLCASLSMFQGSRDPNARIRESLARVLSHSPLSALAEESGLALPRAPGVFFFSCAPCARCEHPCFHPSVHLTHCEQLLRLHLRLRHFIRLQNSRYVFLSQLTAHVVAALSPLPPQLLQPTPYSLGFLSHS